MQNPQKGPHQIGGALSVMSTSLELLAADGEESR